MLIIIITLLLICLILIIRYTFTVQQQIKRDSVHRQVLVEKIKELNETVVKHEKDREGLREELMKEAVDFYEEELQHLGAELHDDMVQRLAEFRLTMDKLDLSEDIIELQAAGLKLKSQYPEIVRSVRRISRRLLPEDLVTGSFTNSLRALCVQKERPGSLIIKFDSQGHELPILNHHALHLYRIVQELIHNTIKHSLAWHLLINVTWTNVLLIEIEDDGKKALPMKEITNASAFRTLRMRALKSGAEFSFSKAQKGMLVTVKYNPENAGGVIIK